MTARCWRSSTTSSRSLAEAGVALAGDDVPDVGAVFVAHQDVVDFPKLERAARALLHGAPLLTGSYAPYYAGLDGPIFSRGAMVTAALAKVSGAVTVVGKPSQAAVDAVSDRLGVPTGQIAVIGDDVGMDVALGRMCGARTILVTCGTSVTSNASPFPTSTGRTWSSTGWPRFSTGSDGG